MAWSRSLHKKVTLLGIYYKQILISGHVSGHPRELKKVSISRAVCLQELFP